MIFFSIIVPIFNAKKYIDECLQSIRNQSFREFEVILVDDGSSDGSGAICDAFADLDNRFHCVHQKNEGVSSARNVGISMSVGEYLCFVDADDVLVSDGLSSLIPYCKEGYDLIRFWSELKHPGTVPNKTFADGRIIFQGEGYEYFRKYGLETFCWCYLYRRSFLLENKLRFQPGIIGEDFAFMYDVMMARPTIISLASRIYQYNIVPNSISTKRSPEHSRRWVRDLKDTMKRICLGLDPFREKDPLLYQKCRESLDAKMVSLFSRILSAKFTVTDYKSLLKELTSCGLLPLSSSQTSKREEWAKRFLAILIRFPTLYPAASFLFSRVFLPYVYPKIDRNG